MTSKPELRRLVRAREDAMTPQEKRSSDGVLIRRLLELPEYARAGSVLLYAGVGNEVDTRPVLEDALACGKLTALPKITGPGVMEARTLASLSRLVPGAYGIPEPDGAAVAPEKFDLILVPGAAFTRGGGRLGRGGGFYDRFLPRVRGIKVALARRIQLFDSLPIDPHDIPVDLVITDEED